MTSSTSSSFATNCAIPGGDGKVFRIKIISMGNAEVGKSCIIKRYCEKRFVQKYMATIGIDYGVMRETLNDDVELRVSIFDLAGHPVFQEIRTEFYGDCHGVILVYDVTNRISFEALDAWLKEIKNSEAFESGELDFMKSGIIRVLCANKIDKVHRMIDTVEGQLWADKYGFAYFETSAATGDGVCDVFERLFHDIETKIATGESPTHESQLSYTKEQIEAIQRLRKSSTDWERLGVSRSASKDEINRAYKELARILHPDKCVAPGSEEAFKKLLSARTNLLGNVKK